MANSRSYRLSPLAEAGAVGSHVLYFRRSNTSLDVIHILHGRMDVELH